MLEERIVPFTDELLKIAFVATSPKLRKVEEADKHFARADKDWGRFEKNLRSKTFQEAVRNHPGADEKLQRYTKSYGGYLTSKERVAKVHSESSGKKYQLKMVGRRIACGCGDWQYKRSHGGGDCKHIKAYKAKKRLAGKVKQSFLNDLAHAGSLLSYSQQRAKKSWQRGQLASGAAKQHELMERQTAFQKQQRQV